MLSPWQPSMGGLGGGRWWVQLQTPGAVGPRYPMGNACSRGNPGDAHMLGNQGIRQEELCAFSWEGGTSSLERVLEDDIEAKYPDQPNGLCPGLDSVQRKDSRLQKKRRWPVACQLPGSKQGLA